MVNMAEAQQVEFMEEAGIKMGDKYVIIYRFNPGRKRLVNKVFNEEIEGQVQSFEIIIHN